MSDGAQLIHGAWVDGTQTVLKLYDRSVTLEVLFSLHQQGIINSDEFRKALGFPEWPKA